MKHRKIIKCDSKSEINGRTKNDSKMKNKHIHVHNHEAFISMKLSSQSTRGNQTI